MFFLALRTTMRNMEDTYIKAYRKLLKWRWADNPYMVALWIRLLLTANHADKDWHKIVIKRGQLVTSIAKLSFESGLSKQQVRTCLERLKDTEEIVLESTNKYTIITIGNYADYQANDKEWQQANNNQITNEQQSSNNQITTTKEYKERKESKNNNTPLFVPPTIEDVKTYCQERNNGVDAERFVAYYQSNGWMVGRNKMKDWKAAVRTWEQKEKKDQPQGKPIPGCIWSKTRQEWIPA